MPRPLDFFLWLDGSPARYWILAWSLFALLFLAAVLPSVAGTSWRRWNSPGAYAGLTLLTLLGFRWPGIAQNFELQNPDESQLIAGALTLAHYGYYSGVVDCGSSGPLDIFPLVLPKLMGSPLDYIATRAVGLLLLWGSCVFAWLTLLRVVGDRPGRLLVMPMVCVIAFTHHADFVQYSSEQAPIFFCALAIWLALGAFSPAGRVISRWRLALAGGTLSLLPLAKLQATPFGLCAGLCILAWIFRQEKTPWRTRFADAGWLVGGTVAALLLVGAAVVHGGGVADFYQTFWLANLHYAQSRDYAWSEFGGEIGFLIHLVWGFGHYFIPALVLVGLGLCAWPRLPHALRRFAVFGALLFLTGFFVVVAPGRGFQHYLQFFIFPTTLFLGFIYGGLATGASRPLFAGLWLALAVLVGVGPQVWFRTHDDNPYHGYLQQARARAISPVAQQILSYARPGDTLTVWGWMPTFHVQTQLPQGTRDAHAERQISPNELQPYFRERYFSELEKNQPALFVDAVGDNNFGYHNRTENSHETIARLGDFIRTHYVLVADFDSSRIYLRKDRWAELHP